MHTVLFDFQFTNDIERTTVVGWTVVCISVSRQLDRTGNVAKFRDVR